MGHWPRSQDAPLRKSRRRHWDPLQTHVRVFLSILVVFPLHHIAFRVLREVATEARASDSSTGIAQAGCPNDTWGLSSVTLADSVAPSSRVGLQDDCGAETCDDQATVASGVEVAAPPADLVLESFDTLSPVHQNKGSPISLIASECSQLEGGPRHTCILRFYPAHFGGVTPSFLVSVTAAGLSRHCIIYRYCLRPSVRTFFYVLVCDIAHACVLMEHSLLTTCEIILFAFIVFELLFCGALHTIVRLIRAHFVMIRSASNSSPRLALE